MKHRTDAEILRRVARLVLVRALDAGEFLAAVERAGEMFDRDPPEVVRKLAATVRFRHADACPIELAELLEAEAGRVESEANPAAGSSGVAPKDLRPRKHRRGKNRVSSCPF